MAVNITDRPIEIIQDEIISRDVIRKCKLKGITTLNQIVAKSKFELAGLTSISLPVINRMIEKAYQRLPPVFFLTALELHKEGLCQLKLTTGSNFLDMMLGGSGVECGSVTEIVGENGSGKSQFCMTLSVSCQLPSVNCVEGPACLYIETGSNFSTSRIISIAKRFGLNPDLVLQNIKYLLLPNTVRIEEALQLIQNELRQETYVLLIVDSATWLFRLNYVGQNMKSRNDEMIKKLMPLRSLAHQHRVAVVVTNSTYVKFDKIDPVTNEQEVVPYADTVMAELSKTRIMLRHKKGLAVRECCIFSSPELQLGKCMISIDEGGIIDA